MWIETSVIQSLSVSQNQDIRVRAASLLLKRVTAQRVTSHFGLSALMLPAGNEKLRPVAVKKHEKHEIVVFMAQAGLILKKSVQLRLVCVLRVPF
ncbi:MAG: hypothetical protein Q7U38_07420 [Methylobacter sp.]|nr:hypothetical protein [Methylobacter sp.]